MSDGQLTEAIILPRWFVYFISAVFTLATIIVLPWVIWQTTATMRLEVKMEGIAKSYEKIESFSSHPFEIRDLERRIEQNEQSINSLRNQGYMYDPESGQWVGPYRKTTSQNKN